MLIQFNLSLYLLLCKHLLFPLSFAMEGQSCSSPSPPPLENTPATSAAYPRDYHRFHYLAIEVTPSSSPSETLSKAESIADHYGYTLLGQVGALENYFLYQAPISTPDQGRLQSASVAELPSVRESLSRSFMQALEHAPRGAHPAVASVAYQLPKKRHKRMWAEEQELGSTSQQTPSESLSFQDPLFPAQWHLLNREQVGNDIDVASTWLQIGIDYYFFLLLWMGNWSLDTTGTSVIVALIDDGIDTSHPDIANNFYANSSYDFNLWKGLPQPQLTDDYHGTRCAGEIVAVPNTFCGVGVAFHSQIAGIRMLSGEVDDATEAMAINYHFNENHIYSCSWGPLDDGMTVEGPNRMVESAFRKGVVEGRSGLGSIYVFASGNGGRQQDNCNYDGYANSIYTLTVGAVDRFNQLPVYAEPCSAILISAYSSGSKNYIVTTDVDNKCTNAHGGTSAAAPLVAGAIALMLSVRPDLGWRDVQYLCMSNAIPFGLNELDWEQNYVGRWYSHYFGYGKLSVANLLQAAENHVLLGPQVGFNSGPLITSAPLPIPEGPEGVTLTYEYSKSAFPSLTVLEHVTVTVSLTHQLRGDIEILLESPNNVTSILATRRPHDMSSLGLKEWTFMTLKHWQEEPVGFWVVKVLDRNVNGRVGKVISCSIQFFGESSNATQTVPNDPFPSAPAAPTTPSSVPIPSPSPTPSAPLVLNPTVDTTHQAASPILLFAGIVCVLVAVGLTLFYFYMTTSASPDASFSLHRPRQRGPFNLFWRPSFTPFGFSKVNSQENLRHHLLTHKTAPERALEEEDGDPEFDIPLTPVHVTLHSKDFQDKI